MFQTPDGVRKPVDLGDGRYRVSIPLTGPEPPQVRVHFIRTSTRITDEVLSFGAVLGLVARPRCGFDGCRYCRSPTRRRQSWRWGTPRRGRGASSTATMSGWPTTASWDLVFPAGPEAWAAHAARGGMEGGTPASLPVVPIQLVLAGVELAIFTALYRSWLRLGVAAGSAAMAYGVARLALEPLPDDFSPFLGPLALPQLLALVLMGCGTAMLVAPGRPGPPVPARAPAKLSRRQGPGVT
jgi:hypothetical protein